MARILIVVGLVLALGSTAFAQTPNITPTETLSEKVNQLFAKWDKPDTPGCALAVIKDVQ
ncbi:MAG TPA: hypothetical protein VEY11_12925 [Pyrinomonadaceae bacterium]|nr:hypothetical protein [Pyrinomonadaceae bacterium]